MQEIKGILWAAATEVAPEVKTRAPDTCEIYPQPLQEAHTLKHRGV